MPDLKQRIDSMTYTQLLRHWRFAPAGDPMLQGETGEYFAKVMREKGISVGEAERVSASKSVGWEQ